MTARRQLVVSLLVQGIGAVAVLSATVLLGAFLGPEEQGRFSAVKASIEFVAALAMFGLPQSLFFHLKSARIGSHAAKRAALACAALALPIAAAFGLLQTNGGWSAAAAVGVLAVGLVVAHGQFRALLLALDRTGWFNAVTALPQALMLLGVGFVIVAVGRPVAPWSWPTLFAGAYGAAFALAWWQGRAVLREAPAAGARWTGVVRYGAAAWISAALASAAVVATQRWTVDAQGPAVLGRLTMAMTWAQVPLTPIAYAAPLLFGRWMEHSGRQSSRRLAGASAAALLATAAILGMLSIQVPDLFLGPAYAGTTLALAVLLVGGAGEATSRILAINANALGRPWLAVRAELARWTMLVLGALLLRPANLLSICLLWSLGTWAAAAVFLVDDRLAPAARTVSIGAR